MITELNRIISAISRSVPPHSSHRARGNQPVRAVPTVAPGVVVRGDTPGRIALGLVETASKRGWENAYSDDPQIIAAAWRPDDVEPESLHRLLAAGRQARSWLENHALPDGFALIEHADAIVCDHQNPQRKQLSQTLHNGHGNLATGELVQPPFRRPQPRSTATTTATADACRRAAGNTPEASGTDRSCSS
ncbi:hypothetical protein QRX50_46800 [Amycolatopsis carbonis]|uniref:Uncharacterized protein n=1 Tax=Amycolatopsis carbonis TaxID=715471 RepID=A0A9Y2II47_9PSEU|nr:hypothetical protein [Amycolatopsis sp. 2-15]WIX78763.1 hypothetical protein QRX50_46800 [Amycolatopsis sp. 2-15]